MESTITVASANPDIRSSKRPTRALRRLWLAAGAYAALGLIAGLFYRTLTHSRDFDGTTVLALAHTHLLALGMLVMLVVLVLEHQFNLSATRSFVWFEITYHVGLLVTVGALITRGTLQVVATDPTSAALPGIAGLGHILLTAAFVLLFLGLGKALRRAA